MNARLPFFGRQRQLDLLNQLKKKQTSSLVVIKGRRRIGKSRLIREYITSSKSTTSYTFVGIPPDPKTTAQDQRDQPREARERYARSHV